MNNPFDPLNYSSFCDTINIHILRRCKMAVCYNRLFHLLIDKRVSNTQLKEQAGFSANIITRLKRNEYISLETVERICTVLDCGVDDILEFSSKTADDVASMEE